MGARYDVAVWVRNAPGQNIGRVNYHWENRYQGNSLTRALLAAARARLEQRRTGRPVQVVLR